MNNVTKQVHGPARAGHGRGHHDERAGRHRDGDRHRRDHARHRKGLDGAEEFGVYRDDPVRSRGAGIPGPVKLIPGVQYTQDAVRGPSAGGSGQDNVYKFDGVNVTLPLFGTLSAEPASHDIAQVTTIKGGAKAVDFDRSGGFTVDSVSKSGTVAVLGPRELPAPERGDGGEPERARLSRYDQDRTWLTASLGGPVDQEQGVLLRLVLPADANAAERVERVRPAARLREHAQRGVRQGDHHPDQPGAAQRELAPVAPPRHRRHLRRTVVGDDGKRREAWQKIGIAEGSWIINARSFASFKYTHFENPTQGRPGLRRQRRHQHDARDEAGRRQPRQDRPVHAPVPVAGQPAFNSFIQPLIDRYGYHRTTGVMTGGGTVGYGTSSTRTTSTATPRRCAYNITLGTDVRHDIHAGFQWYVDSEDLQRTSNGWGVDHGARRPPRQRQLRRRQRLLPGRSSSSSRSGRCRPSTPSTGR